MRLTFCSYTLTSTAIYSLRDLTMHCLIRYDNVLSGILQGGRNLEVKSLIIFQIITELNLIWESVFNTLPAKKKYANIHLLV